jgi:small subunit ribosomal protein S1
VAKKKTVDLFEEDSIAKPQNEFDALLDGTGIPTRTLRVGDKFRGEILAINGKEAFVSTGTPIEAVMPLDLRGDIPQPKVGDFVEVVVVRARDNEILVKAVGSSGAGIEVENLEDAYNMGIAVEGIVLEQVKGGFRVKVHGTKAFCPVSQMDWRVVVPEDYVGKKFSFLITKFERGRDLVISRRKLMEVDRAASETEFLKTAEVGTIFTGTVFRLEKYGAFVRLENSVEGLIPISELSWGRIGHPQEVVNMDQSVQVKLIRASQEEGRLKLSFSLKQGGSALDPWAMLETNYPVGSQCEGVIENRESFGLFVNIAPGVTGLLPRSAWRESTEANQYEMKRRGDKVRVRIDRIDMDAHRLSFSVPGEEDDNSWRDHTANATTPASRGKNLGTLGDLLKAAKKG